MVMRFHLRRSGIAQRQSIVPPSADDSMLSLPADPLDFVAHTVDAVKRRWESPSFDGHRVDPPPTWRGSAPSSPVHEFRLSSDTDQGATPLRRATLVTASLKSGNRHRRACGVKLVRPPRPRWRGLREPFAGC